MPLARSRFHARRNELARAHDTLNLVPLVDILTAIVFFSLLSAVSLRTALASFDLVTPPAASEVAVEGNIAPLTPDLVVRVDRHQFVVRHGDGETLIARDHGADEVALTTLRLRLADLARALGHRAAVTVVPSDDVSYDDVINVLEQVQQVDPKAMTLGSRARMPRN